MLLLLSLPVGGITDKLLIAAANKAIEKRQKLQRMTLNRLRLKHIEVIDGLLSGEVHETTLDIVLKHLSQA